MSKKFKLVKRVGHDGEEVSVAKFKYFFEAERARDGLNMYEESQPYMVVEIGEAEDVKEKTRDDNA